MSAPFHFPVPEPLRVKKKIYPVFLPFSGCPQRCVFCAQDVQTGHSPAAIPLCLERADLGLRRDYPVEKPEQDRRPPSSQTAFELAFFGGTFTSLPEADLAACLAFAARWRERGVVSGLRCSTRPDALSPGLLARLADAGFTCVELGVQSFSDAALAASGRGYDGAAAIRGCEMVKKAGLELGIQLLPGMPSHGQKEARADVARSIALGPDCVRLYPCLVLDGTVLAGMWRLGRYRPWNLEETVDFLTVACRDFHKAGIPVIRMGLAEEPGLAGRILAGPRHPSLGSMVRAHVLLAYIREKVAEYEQGYREKEPALPLPGGKRILLRVPRRYQGEFWGHRAELLFAYQELGLGRDNVQWHDAAYCTLSRL